MISEKDIGWRQNRRKGRALPSASPGTEGQEGSDAGSSGRVNSSGKGTGSDAGGDNSIEDFPGTDVYKPYIPSNSPRAPKDAECGQGAGSLRRLRRRPLLCGRQKAPVRQLR
ncbi:hypothetical protein [Scardovia wiggsiae]|uniref:hypothetical protein n=2 Tax=Scardovia wiggsiae TaxID=230143 RepID=UPI0037506C05